MSVHKKDNGTWFVQYRMPGEKSPRREYFTVGEYGEQQAKARDKEIKQLKAEGKRPIVDKMYLDQLGQSYLDERKLAGKSAAWLEEMERLFNQRFLPELCGVPVDELTYNDVVKMAAKHMADIKLSSRQRYLGYLLACFNYGVKYGLTNNNPLKLWTKQPEPKLEFELTFSGLEAIYNNASKHLQWAIAVEWEVGARPGPSELYALKWRHVNFERCMIRIPGTKNVHSNRLIPIMPAFRDELANRMQMAESEFVIEYKGHGLKTMKTAFNSAQRRAKLPYHVRMYDIRHLFVTMLLSNNADLNAVSRMIGHSEIATTQEWYWHLLPGKMEQAITLKPRLNGGDIQGHTEGHTDDKI